MSDAELNPRKSPRQQRSARTVDRILDAAVRVFDDVGYFDTTTNEIALEARVSIGSLYQYFPNKDALLVAVARRHVAASLLALDAMITDLTPPADIDQVIGRVIDLLVAQHEHDRLHLLIAHQAPRTAELDQELQIARRHMVDIAARLMVERIPATEKRLMAAQLTVATLDVAVHDVILRQPPGPLRDGAIEMTKSAVAGITGG